MNIQKISYNLFAIKALAITSVLVFASLSSCSNNPEGAFSKEEKTEQDSTDSTSQEQGFEALMLQDSLAKDTQK